MNPWSNQKALSLAGNIPTQKELLGVAQTLQISQEKALFILTYLTAGRASEVLSLTAESFEKIDKEGRSVVLIKMLNRKNKIRHYKELPIPMDKENEKEMMDIILSFIEGKTGLIFGFKSTARSWQIFKKIGYNPHWLRHIRLTHLETIYGLSGERIKNFAGWTDTRPAKNYMELNWGDVLKGM